MADNDDLMTPQEVAKLLGVATSSLVRWRRETRRRNEQIGPYWIILGHRTVKYRRSAVLQFIDSREQRADG